MVTVSLSAEGSDWVIRVGDEGEGIPADALPRLFRRFSRIVDEGRDKPSGVGLGLLIVKTVAERHGGSVAVDSQLGQGSTFELRLPLRSAAVPGVTAWKHVSVGVRATCAVATHGDLYCWGSNQYGQLGVAGTEDRLLPNQVALSGWDTVEMGNYRVGARRTDGSFYYWGVNAASSPTQVAGNDWVLVDNTGFGECGIKTDGTLHCTFQGVAGTFQAGSANDWVSIVGPGYPYCALNSQGAVGCFVNNGSNNGFNSSPAIDPSSGWSQLVSGDQSVCGLRNGTERHCRGYRQLGSLGDGFDERVPTAVVH